jgi:hypothetical protein
MGRDRKRNQRRTLDYATIYLCSQPHGGTVLVTCGCCASSICTICCQKWPLAFPFTVSILPPVVSASALIVIESMTLLGNVRRSLALQRIRTLAVCLVSPCMDQLVEEPLFVHTLVSVKLIVSGPGLRCHLSYRWTSHDVLPMCNVLALGLAALDFFTLYEDDTLSHTT